MTDEVANNPNHTPELIPALDAITRAMDEAEYRYNRNDTVITATFPTDSCDLAFRAKATQQSIQTTVRYSIRIPEGRRLELLEFMNSINWQTTLSNLEMDPRDGEIACRLSVPLETGRLSLEQADTALHVVLGAAARYADPIVRMVFQNMTATEALETLGRE